jgi:hypothetical protein
MQVKAFKGEAGGRLAPQQTKLTHAAHDFGRQPASAGCVVVRYATGAIRLKQ